MSVRFAPIDPSFAASLHLGPWLFLAALALSVIVLLVLHWATEPGPSRIKSEPRTVSRPYLVTTRER